MQSICRLITKSFLSCFGRIGAVFESESILYTSRYQLFCRNCFGNVSLPAASGEFSDRIFCLPDDCRRTVLAGSRNTADDSVHCKTHAVFAAASSGIFQPVCSASICACRISWDCAFCINICSDGIFSCIWNIIYGCVLSAAGNPVWMDVLYVIIRRRSYSVSAENKFFALRNLFDFLDDRRFSGNFAAAIYAAVGQYYMVLIV